MKPIIIVEKELHGKFPEYNKRVIIKKNKTIIKDNKILDDPNVVKSLGVEYNWYLEEWEILNEDKVQLICANNGVRLRPVHIISNLQPRNGAKALFQSKKLIVLKIQDGVFELSKNSITEEGKIEVNVLQVGEYRSILDVKNKIESDYLPMVKSLIKNKSEYLDNYLAPVWGEN